MGQASDHAWAAALLTALFAQLQEQAAQEFERLAAELRQQQVRP